MALAAARCHRPGSAEQTPRRASEGPAEVVPATHWAVRLWADNTSTAPAAAVRCTGCRLPAPRAVEHTPDCFRNTMLTVAPVAGQP
jgi:hypothetical protein